MELFKFKDYLLKIMAYSKYFRLHKNGYSRILEKPYSFGFFIYEPYLKCKSLIKREDYLSDYKLYCDQSSIFPFRFISFASELGFFRKSYSYIFLTKKSRKRIKIILESINSYFSSRYEYMVKEKICKNEKELKVLNYLYDLVLNPYKYNTDYLFDYLSALSNEIDYGRTSYITKVFIEDFDIFIEANLMSKISNSFLNKYYLETFLNDVEKINNREDLIKEMKEKWGK